MISLIISICMAADPKGIDFIQNAVKKYNAATGVTMQVKKTVKLALLDETKVSEGKLYFSKGNLRLEISKPDESLLVLNQEAIWVETSAEGFDGPAKKNVMKIVSKDLKKHESPLAHLLTSQKAWQDFEVTKQDKTDAIVKLQLKPKVPAKYSDMTTVNVTIDSSLNEILKLSYADEIENEVIFEFTSTDVSKKISKSKFSYKPPKNAEVVVY